MATIEDIANDLALKAQHYAEAFRLAALAIENRGAAYAPDNKPYASMAGMLLLKAELEETFVRQLRSNPVRTLSNYDIYA